MAKELKPFGKILVRNSNKGYWIPALYGFKSKDMKHYLTSAGWQDECIPYEGNEEYLGTNKDYVCRNFPEIVESEDKRISKALIKYLDALDDDEIRYGVSFKDMRTWLEKQGEQKTVSKVKIGKKYRCCNSVRYTCFQIGKVYEVKDSFDVAMISLCSDYFVLVDDSVEQKPDDKVEHKFKVGDVIRLKGSAAEYTIKRVTDTTYYTDGWSCGIERCEEDYELVEQKPAEWSEEDEEYLKAAIWYAENPAPNVAKNAMLVEWVKNLKGRVQPQPKQEWSEEDGRCIRYLIECLEVCVKGTAIKMLPSTAQKYIEWLKSLRPQTTWKPTKEQIKALDYLIRCLGESGTVTAYDSNLHCATALLQDLKKMIDDR